MDPEATRERMITVVLILTTVIMIIWLVFTLPDNPIEFW